MDTAQAAQAHGRARIAYLIRAITTTSAICHHIPEGRSGQGSLGTRALQRPATSPSHQQYVDEPETQPSSDQSKWLGCHDRDRQVGC